MTRGGPGRDAGLRCWACPAALSLASILHDGFLKSRSERLGGPYVLAECPSCRRKLRCERNAAGRHFISPADDFSALDSLLQFFDSDLRRRYWEDKAWRARHAERRRHFFAEGLAAGEGAAEAEAAGAGARESGRGGDAAAERALRPPPVLADDVRRALGVLGVDAVEPWSEVSRAFRRQCKLCHPDRFALHDEAYRHVASRRFSALKEAYDLLRREWKPLRERGF